MALPVVMVVSNPSSVRDPSQFGSLPLETQIGKVKGMVYETIVMEVVGLSSSLARPVKFEMNDRDTIFAWYHKYTVTFTSVIQKVRL
jgi:hypothetical protein